MRTLLYLISSSRVLAKEPLFVGAPDGTGESEVVLLQDAVGLTEIPTPHVSVLDEDLKKRGGTSPFPSITYQTLLEKIFSAQRVICI